MKSIIICLLSVVMSATCWGQTETIPSIELVNGNNTLKGTLPYGRPFNVTGSTKLPFDRTANLIKLVISESEKNKDVDTVLWWKTTDNNTTFSLYVSQPLKFETQYTFKFHFYNGQKISKEKAERWTDEILSEIAKEYKDKKSFTREELESSISEKLESKLKNSPSFDDELFKASVYDTEVNFGTELDDFFTHAAEKISAFSALSENEELLASYKTKFTSLKIEDLVKTLRQSAKDSLTQKKKIGFDTIHIAELAKIKTWEDFKTADKKNVTEVFTPLYGNKEIRGLIDLKRDVNDKLNLVNTQKGLVKGKESEDNFSELIRQLGVEIENIGSFNSITSSKAYTGTELAVIRFSTAYGAAFVGLNPLNKISGDASPYLALKYYFNPVDKRLAEPYLTEDKAFPKASFLVGFLVGGDALKYEGQQLNKIGGINPLIGVGFDFLRYFSADFGTVFFKQPSLSSVDNASALRMAPFIGLSLDPDAFNRLSALFSNKNYNLNK